MLSCIEGVWGTKNSGLSGRGRKGGALYNNAHTGTCHIEAHSFVVKLKIVIKNKVIPHSGHVRMRICHWNEQTET